MSAHLDLRHPDREAPGAWAEHAACKSVDPDVFFPVGRGHDGAAAEAVCRRCPVKDACLDHAVRNKETQGVWGGTTPRERRRLPEWRRTICAECGVVFAAAYGTQVLCSGECQRVRHNRIKAESKARFA